MKKNIFLLCLIIFLSSVTFSFSADKVVVIPLSSSSGKHVYAGGLVRMDGLLAREFGGEITAVKNSTGNYTVTLPNYGPGCSRDPIVVVSLTTPGYAIPFEAVASCGTGDVSITVFVYSTSNSLSDRHFTFVAYSPDQAVFADAMPAQAIKYDSCTFNYQTMEKTCR